ncbi:MAG TPA: hypothetical protein VMT99_00110 [Candidatus Paceibacterota bacterium]|nr:hypothetical protein [Candidatus Paceibacterota bacterium]
MKRLIIIAIVGLAAFLGFAAGAPKAHAAAAFVQVVSTTRSANVKTKTVTFGKNVTAGDLLVYGIDSTQSPSSVTSSCTNGNMTIVSSTKNSTDYATWGYGYAAVTGGCAVTVTFSATSSETAIQAIEATDVETVNGLDAWAQATDTSVTAHATGNITTTSNGDYVIGMYMTTGENAGTYTAGGNYALEAQTANGLMMEDQVQNASGTINASTTSSGNMTGVMIVAAFKPSLVYQVHQSVGAINTSTTLTTTVSSTNAGDLLVLFAIDRGSSLTGTPTSSNGSSFTFAASTTGSNTSNIYLYYLPNTASGITAVTWRSAGSATLYTYVAEFAGVTTTSPFDQKNTMPAGASSTSWTAGGVTTTAANELMVGGLRADNSASGFTFSPPWYAEDNNADALAHGYHHFLMYEPDAGSAGANNFTGTLSSNVPYGAIIATFKPSPPPAPDVTAPTPNPMTFSVAPAGASATSISMTSTVASDSSTPVSYLFIYSSTCASDNGTGGSSSSWQASTAFTDSGLQVNQCYAYTVTAKDNVGNTGTRSTTSTAYTLANTPGTPTFSSTTASTIRLSNAANSNPAITLFAIQVTSSSPADANWVGKFVTASGTASSSAVWLTNAQLTNITVSGLHSGTKYYFASEARNGNNVTTTFSTTGSTTTLVSSNPPNAPTLTFPPPPLSAYVYPEGIAGAPTFVLSTTDPDGDNVEYDISVYDDPACGASHLIADYNQFYDETYWSGQDGTISTPNDSYKSGSTAYFTPGASPFDYGATYYWQAEAIDPGGSNTWGSLSACNMFVETDGNWWALSGIWMTSTTANGPAAIAYLDKGQFGELLYAGYNGDAVADFYGKNPNGGLMGVIARSDGVTSNGYLIGFASTTAVTAKTLISNAMSTLATTPYTVSSSSFYNYRDIISGTYPTVLDGLVNGDAESEATANDSTASLQTGNYIGLAATSSKNGSQFIFEGFNLYGSTIVQLTDLPGGASWAIYDPDGDLLGCSYTNQIDLKNYNGVLPLNDLGVSGIAVWTSNDSCNGNPDVYTTSAQIDGGDVWDYGTSGGSVAVSGATTPTASTTISISATGAVTY